MSNPRAGIDGLRIVQLTAMGISAKSFLIEHFKQLRAHGAEVTLVCSDDADGRAAAEAAGVRYIPVKIEQYIAPLADLISLLKLWRVFRDLRPDVIHAHMTKAGLLGILAGWLAGVPVRIYHNHGLAIVTARGLRRWTLLVVERFTHRLATHSLFCSESTRDEAIQAQVVNTSRAQVLGNGTISGVDVAKFRPAESGNARAQRRKAWGVSENDVVVGYVGRLLEEKGIEELIEAWQRLDSTVRGCARLLMVGGDTRGEPRIQRLVENAVRENIGVQALGWVDDMPECYAAMDVVVLPSWREGFPYSVIEAQSTGLPVVATRTTGNVDAIQHDVTGLLVPVRHTGALSEALTRLINSPRERKRLGEQARRRILDKFAQDKVLHHMITFYEEQVAPSAKSKPRG
jgi:glycosyltransferase involved in cell wall biosynthesis